MASLKFKGVVDYIGQKEQITPYFCKREILLKGIEDYEGNSLLISANNAESDLIFKQGEIVIVDYNASCKKAGAQQKYYGSNVLNYFEKASVGMFSDIEDEEDDTSFDTDENGKLLPPKKKSVVDDLLSEMKE